MPDERSRRHIPVSNDADDDAATSEEALGQAVDDATARWDETRDAFTGMLDAERSAHDDTKTK